MSQIGRSYFCARQVIHVFKIQIVPTIIEHVDHLMCEYTLYELFRTSHILADNDLEKEMITYKTLDAFNFLKI